jgi:hypothetical protein
MKNTNVSITRLNESTMAVNVWFTSFEWNIIHKGRSTREYLYIMILLWYKWSVGRVIKEVYWVGYECYPEYKFEQENIVDSMYDF